jgi:hypothetical protein
MVVVIVVVVVVILAVASIVVCDVVAILDDAFNKFRMSGVVRTEGMIVGSVDRMGVGAVDSTVSFSVDDAELR